MIARYTIFLSDTKIINNLFFIVIIIIDNDELNLILYKRYSIRALQQDLILIFFSFYPQNDSRDGFYTCPQPWSGVLAALIVRGRARQHPWTIEKADRIYGSIQLFPGIRS
jgi:hypothetical protein